MLGKLDKYVQKKNETRPPFTPHKNKLKMDEILKS